LHQTRLDQPDEDNVPLRAEFIKKAEGIEARGGSYDWRAIEGPACSPDLLYLWRWFREDLLPVLYTPLGRAPLSHTEIRAWAENTGRAPDPFEVRMLRLLDQATRTVANETRDQREDAINTWLTSLA
jgi:hypothetical protein